MENMEKLFVFICGFFMLATVFAGYMEIRHSQQFNRWTSNCMAQKGMIQLVSHDRYECFVNGEIVYVSY